MLRRSSQGVTLIELIAVLAIIAVLAALALPGFETQVRRARRADAWVATMRVQAAQERFRSRAPGYGNLAEIGMADRSEGGHYGLEIAARDAHGFELLATAAGVQSRDESCRHMRLRSRYMTPVYASGPDRTVSNGASANRRCWNP
jgi:type IV pilus assembly protein PilE